MKRIVLLFLAAVAPVAHAVERPLWEAGAGGFGMRLPDYRGSDEYRNYLLPIPYFVYRGEFLKVDRGGATGVLYREARTELDLTLNAANPVNSSKNRAREGMPSLSPVIELGPRLKLTIAADQAKTYELSVQLPVRGVVTLARDARAIGVVANPLVNLDLVNVANSRWSLGLQGGPIFADRTYHRYYYEVDPAYARSDRPAYRASGGYGGTQFTVALSRRYQRMWVGAFVRAFDLHGAAFESSPLVRSKSAVLAGIGIAYVFAESTTKVDAPD